ncbi:hypothetical protein Tmar_1964 [Thermaerobacter marianensis DSM 12885]|uniref:DUF4870 domain-containing protein n=1 Tax=Thermaerobacter marianensis (strain ATCC 700841 / DSM 12885 / JCM 10246 / 7p75a) TaxID=644966 RepID=E6SJ23_THEM7|nr:DUF4870 domain-containing protein [Thermaerobacter marianensis]ADU52047.1 hypothetical protein Tmar_1964 [Thermaerobacter marianensis DSM 12885]
MDDTSANHARSWAVACHLAALAGFWIPLGNLLGPLVLWLVKRNDHPFIDRQGKEALNFQISVTLYAVVLIVLAVFLLIPVGMLDVVFGPVEGPGFIDAGPRITAFLLVLLLVLLGGAATVGWLVLVVVAAVRASRGEDYRYPLTLRLVR